MGIIKADNDEARRCPTGLACITLGAAMWAHAVPAEAQSCLPQAASSGCYAAPLTVVDDSLFQITQASQVATKRQQLVTAIWGTTSLPSAPVNVTHGGPGNAQITNLENVDSVDRLDMFVGNHRAESAYLYRAAASNGQVVIVHGGHSAQGENDDLELVGNYATSDRTYGLKRLTRALLRDGYSVVSMRMPGWAPQTPNDHSHCGVFQRGSSPLRSVAQYVEPVIRVVEHVTRLGYSRVHMMGISGGGWTTTLSSALDPRIEASVDIAGSMPLYFRCGDSFGDWEQWWPQLYSIAGYLDLYLLASAGRGRRRLQVYNVRDCCVFNPNRANWNSNAASSWAGGVRAYERRVREHLALLGLEGTYRASLDEAAQTHTISWPTVQEILTELNGGRRVIGAISSSEAWVRGANTNIWRRNSAGWSDTGVFTVAAPAVGTLNGAPALFHRGVGNSLLMTQPAGNLFVSTVLRQVQTNSDPHVVMYNGQPHVFVHDESTVVRHLWQDRPGHWAEEQVSALTDTIFAGATATFDAQGRYVVFGRSAERAVWIHASSTPPQWPWIHSSLGGLIRESPSVAGVAGAPVAVRGLGDGLWIYEANGSGGYTSPSFAGAAGRLAGAPSASRNGAQDVVFSRSRTGSLLRLTRNGSSWTEADLGGGITDSPTAVGGSCFVRGLGGSLFLHDGSSYVSLGGRFD